MSAIHYYLTFNPFLNHEYEQDYSQAHEFYDYLKDLVIKDKKSTAYWGKFIGKDRDASVNIEQFQKIHTDNLDEGFSTHLYITDFKNLWVGKVKSVTNQMPKNGKTLPFYDGKKVEVWFEIEDFMLLEHKSEETASKLSELYIDNGYSEKIIHGLSPFTTSIKYPCLLQDIAEEQYFDKLDTSDCSHLVLKSNPAITKSNADQVLKSLHAYVFPEEMYSKLPYAARLEIESAEVDMLEQRHHNMHKIAFSYLRALEVVLNDLVVHHIKKSGNAEHFFVDATSAPPKLYLNPTKDYFIPLKQFNKNFSISHLLNFVDRSSSSTHMGFKKSFSEHKQFIRYMTKELNQTIRDNKLIEIRNALAHGETQKLTFKDASAIRNIILGCGTPGLIQMCYRTFYKDKFQSLYNVSEFNQKAEAKDNKKNISKTGLKLVG
ncbi:MAG: hypothetical protein HON90_17875 [Halobacteriovoraceae bacterium]|jgi:hypothetical protein|nr:hypothetical protein [Halobacteriovoraceae bacterium]